jgi:hypothetical protein
LGTAWQEEHPPILKIVSPLAALGAAAVTVWDQRIGGAESHQYALKAAIPAKSSTRKIRRSIQPTVTMIRTLGLAAAPLQSYDTGKYCGAKADFGNKAQLALL